MKFNKVILILLLVLTATSCTRVDLEDPLKGNITLVTDWSKRTAGIEQPANYWVVMAGQTINCTEAITCLPELNAGTYPIYVYNSCDKIIIHGNTATVASTNNIVETNPGWLFTAVTEAVYSDFKVETIITVMQQQIRQLTIILKPEGGTIDRITGITANLSGICGAWDFKANQPQGSTMNMPFTFTKQNDGTWQATVRLLGIIGTQQKLTGTIAFEGGAPTDIILDSDLSTSLSNFNRDKTTPLSLRGDMKETPTELGFVTNVTDWVRVDESVIAE